MIIGAFPYDLNNLLGGATRVLIAPIGATLPTKPLDIFMQQAPYLPVGTGVTAGSTAIGAVTLNLGPAGTWANLSQQLPTAGTIFFETQTAAVTYTGKTATTLTGVPASGTGSVTATIPDGSVFHTATGWRDLGATREAFSYGRNVEVGAYQIQQVTGNVLEEVTNTERTARASVAEIDAYHLALLEEGVRGAAVAADGTGHAGAFEPVGFGSIHDLTQYRCAFVSRRAKQAGIVTEVDGTTTRGRYVTGVGYRVQLAAENVEIAQAKGELASAQVTFRFFPEPTGVAEGQEFGSWFLERAGTLT